MILASFFLLAAAMNFGYLFLLLLQRLLLLLLVLVPGWENTMEKITSWQGNTMPLKDTEAPKLHPENASRKLLKPLLFPLAAAMNFATFTSGPQMGKTPWKKSPPCSKTPCL